MANTATKPNPYQFTEATKKLVMERDEYRCLWCGMGKAEGYKLYVEAISLRGECGEATVDNGVTVCEEHRSEGMSAEHEHLAEGVTVCDNHRLEGHK